MPSKRLATLPLALLLVSACQDSGTFPDQEDICQFNADRELQRADSAASFISPAIETIAVNGVVVWESDNPLSPAPTLRPGDIVTLTGQGLGNGPDIDFTKIMIGNSRILETDLTMYKQYLDTNKQVNFEVNESISEWLTDVISWSNDLVEFTVPDHVSQGPLVLQVQKRTGYLESLLSPGEPHLVINALTKRITDDAFEHECDVVSTLSATKTSASIPVSVDNTNFADLVRQGREVFWSYDYNIGLAHDVRHLKWSKIFDYQTTDPITQTKADPKKLFGAVPAVRGEVPDEAIDDVYFDPYPQPNPIPGLLTIEDQLLKGNTRSSGWVGYRYAESSNPYTGHGERIGFNCASCHGYRISYEKTPGQTVTKVIPGLPNPQWSMKWAVIGDKLGKTTANFDGIEANEPGPSWAPGDADVDKTTLIYYMPAGAGEHNIVRESDEGSETDNDYQFSPIAIPNVTHYTSIRRSLSHTESYVGFEGSYIHSEEPDGAMGAMLTEPLKALTAYMTTLDQDDNDLRNVGLYRWLKWKGKLASQVGNVSEGQFVQNGWQHFSGVSQAVAQGKQVFDRDCGSCHTDGVGANTNERMFRLDEVGRFFAPTIYQKEQQSIRATFLRDVYWTQSRGLLSDGHVRNIDDLVNPDRCNTNSALYKQYYTLHAPVTPALGSLDQPAPYPAENRKGDVFRVPVTKNTLLSTHGTKRNRFIERHKYFSKVSWDANYYYWDYQKMRAEYGPAEMGTSAPIGLPATPHPWCAQNAAEVDALVQYVLTL